MTWAVVMIGELGPNLTFELCARRFLLGSQSGSVRSFARSGRDLLALPLGIVAVC